MVVIPSGHHHHSDILYKTHTEIGGVDHTHYVRSDGSKDRVDVAKLLQDKACKIYLKTAQKHIVDSLDVFEYC